MRKSPGIVKCCCATSEWRSDEFTSVCCNGDSERRADFVAADDCCPEWEAKKDKEEGMLIKDLAAEIHQNAVEHGWWEGNRRYAETIALIHSEWSEALEEARRGKPLVYRACLEDPEEADICRPKDEHDCRMFGKETECKYYGKKPEGIAVELIDGCIRILDYLARCGHFLTQETLDWTRRGMTAQRFYIREGSIPPDDLPELISDLHAITSDAYRTGSERLEKACMMAMRWVERQGIDPVKLMIEKHAYNKTRPYKHGKKF